MTGLFIPLVTTALLLTDGSEVSSVAVYQEPMSHRDCETWVAEEVDGIQEDTDLAAFELENVQSTFVTAACVPWAGGDNVSDLHEDDK